MSTPRIPEPGTPPGIALYRFLQSQWDVLDIKPTTWCREADIPDPTVLRWKTGVEPDMRNLRRVAEALHRPVLDVLLAAGYIRPEEVDGREVPPLLNDSYEAIRLDPDLSEPMRDALLAVWRSLRDVESGAASRVRISSAGRKSRGRKSA